ncbi:MAG: SCO family protein [Steroidobacteraceae bacterium]
MAFNRNWVLLALLAVLGTVAGAWVGIASRAQPPQLQSGTLYPAPRPLPPFALRSADGRPIANADLNGHPTILFFGFTNCPDVCPTTLALIAEVQRRQPVPGLQIWFVSVDPRRDTPQRLAAYLHGFAAAITGVTGEAKPLADFATALGIAVAEVALPGGDYTVDHTAALLVLNDRGAEVAVFTPPHERDALVRDLQALRPLLSSGG